jgi:hypothetical protein
MTLTRLASRSNYKEVEKEWRYEFVQYVISKLGIPDEMFAEIKKECLPDDYEDFGVDQRILLRKHLSTFDLFLLDSEQELEIYLKNSGTNEKPTMLAKWGKSLFNLKHDPREIDPKNKLYIEIVANPWTIFEDETEEDE